MKTTGSIPIILRAKTKEDLLLDIKQFDERLNKSKSNNEKIFDLENQINKSLNESIKQYENLKNKKEKEKNKMDEKITMTEEQINEVTRVLEENVSEDVKHLREINDTPFPHNTINKPELLEGEALVEINPVTGEQVIIGSADGKTENDVTISDIVDGTDEDILNSVTIKKETYSKLNEYGLTNEETEQFTSVILRRLQGEKFSIYKELPIKIKNMVRSMCGSNNINQLQACSEIVVDQFISELKIEQEFVDFQDSLKKEIGSLDMMNAYDEYIKETMEDKILEKANQLEATEPEKAKTLREISQAFKDSYDFTTMKKALNENWKEARRLDKEIKKYDRYCTEFNYKYKNSKFKINDIKLIAHSLDRAFKGEVSISTIKKFVVLFCRITRNMNPNNVVEHSYMYYTIKNILSLDYMQIDSEAYKNIVKQIHKVISYIERNNTMEECNKLSK